MGLLAFKHDEARCRPNKLAARAKKMHLVGYDAKSRSYRLWDPAEPLKITNAAEVSFRKKETRDVVSPKVGYDPLPEPGRITYQPGSAETHEEEKEEEEGKEENEGVKSGPQTQQPDLRRSSRTPVPRQVLNLHTTEEAYERIEHSLLTGSELGNIGMGRPGEVGYMPSDPANYNEAVRGPCLLYTSPSPRDLSTSRMPSSA